jgi:rSAM/selenodomain-associated transferase 2
MTLSLIIPVLNEAVAIGQLLQQLTTCLSPQIEIIVVDGGSNDKTRAIIDQYDGVNLIESTRGRAKQMNAGAAVATGETLLFMHADTRVCANFNETAVMLASLCSHQWGFFTVTLSGQHWMYRVIESMINFRSSLTGVATGDQCIFIVREVFNRYKGYADMPLMEDVELTKRLKRHSAPFVIDQMVTTSSRRWESRGIIATVLLMWRLRFLYFMGVSPKKLARFY